MPEIKLSPEVVQNYFAQLNPIAQRIASDINETKENYGQLWCTLTLSEQNDIINETLIRPDLSLRYFDNFSSTSSISSASTVPSSCDIEPSASADSLAAVVLKNLNGTLEKNEKGKSKSQEKSNEKKDSKKGHNMRQYYSYDGRNLRTFALQKVAIKIIQDDALGAYRDEHSMPFSYRTKSQMNLHLFTEAEQENRINNEIKDDEICLLNSKLKTKRESSHVTQDIPKQDRICIENYKKLQNELKMNLRRDSKEKTETKATQNNSTAAYERLDNQKSISNVSLPLKSHKSQVCNRPQVKPPPAPISAANTNGNNKKSIIVDCKNLQSSSEQRFKSYLGSNANTAAISSTSISYAVYSDSYYDHGEKTNLMQNFGSSHGSGILTASSSSAATSDDDDEKTLCEEMKLLDNDANLRKGFDFLNNW